MNEFSPLNLPGPDMHYERLSPGIPRPCRRFPPNNSSHAPMGNHVLRVAASLPTENAIPAQRTDAKVVAGENAIPADPIYAKAGEIGIVNGESPDTDERRKDSKLRRFKYAVTEFVKELLMPSWRERSIMRKQDFKSIAKKTVQKVIMETRQIPESWTMIDNYIKKYEGRIRKLTMAHLASVKRR